MHQVPVSFRSHGTNVDRHLPIRTVGMKKDCRAGASTVLVPDRFRALHQRDWRAV
jgi:hypothetical protein